MTCALCDFSDAFVLTVGHPSVSQLEVAAELLHGFINAEHEGYGLSSF